MNAIEKWVAKLHISYLHCRYPEHANVKQPISYKSCDVVGKEIEVKSNNTEKRNDIQ